MSSKLYSLTKFDLRPKREAQQEWVPKNAKTKQNLTPEADPRHQQQRRHQVKILQPNPVRKIVVKFGHSAIIEEETVSTRTPETTERLPEKAAFRPAAKATYAEQKAG